MLVETLWRWIPGGTAQTLAGAMPFSVDWAYQVDPLSSVMILVVTLVGFLIQRLLFVVVGRMEHWIRRLGRDSESVMALPPPFLLSAASSTLLKSGLLSARLRAPPWPPLVLQAAVLVTSVALPWLAAMDQQAALLP
ncbi:MAG: hypothetical protein HGB14_06760, partial [Anaerolineaceae bacterium]|nr:hypothetical protein [Anaerolineaceae bacterium]